MILDTVAIVGVGLLGGSVGAALRERRLAKTVIGIGRSTETLAEAGKLGIIDHAAADLEQGVREANLVVVATPVDTIPTLVARIKSATSVGTLITDCGSTKVSIVKSCTHKTNAGPRFVGSHPLAGGEKTGPAAARADLFDGRTVVVTPGKGQTHDDEAVSTIAEFWAALGASVYFMSPAEHDKIVAATSHLPHVAAAALARMFAPADRPLIGTGWRGTTRVASGDAEMWTAIALDNRKPILDALKKYAKSLTTFVDALEQEDARRVKKFFAEAKERRDAVES